MQCFTTSLDPPYYKSRNSVNASNRAGKQLNVLCKSWSKSKGQRKKVNSSLYQIGPTNHNVWVSLSEGVCSWYCKQWIKTGCKNIFLAFLCLAPSTHQMTHYFSPFKYPTILYFVLLFFNFVESTHCTSMSEGSYTLDKLRSTLIRLEDTIIFGKLCCDLKKKIDLFPNSLCTKPLLRELNLL